MDTAKVGVGETIAAVSAVALFIFMFLPWYGTDPVTGVDVGTIGASSSAWEAFALIDLILLAICVLVVGLVLMQATESRVDLPRPPAQIVAGAGVVAFLVIFFRLVFAPGVDAGGLELDLDQSRRIGMLLALIAAAGIAYGGWRATEQEPPSGRPPPADAR